MSGTANKGILTGRKSAGRLTNTYVPSGVTPNVLRDRRSRISISKYRLNILTPIRRRLKYTSREVDRKRVSLFSEQLHLTVTRYQNSRSLSFHYLYICCHFERPIRTLRTFIIVSFSRLWDARVKYACLIKSE